VEPPCGAEPRFELGPALQQAGALPTELRCTLTELRCTITELRCTLNDLRCTLTELRCTLLQAIFQINKFMFYADYSRFVEPH
jgi:hypothetical protein